MPHFLNINGQLTEVDEANAFKSRAFLYGDGIFESIRIINGRAVFLKKHFQRLSHGLKQLKIYNHLDFRSFSQEVKKCISANDIKAGGRMRITAYRESGGLYLPESNQLQFTMEATALKNDTYVLNTNGLIVDVCEGITLSQDSFSNIKTLNALPYVMAGIYKKEQRLDDVLLLNTEGNICEASSSNIFLSAGNTLLTPSLDQGCIAGIMRNEILQIAKSMGMKIVEASVKTSELEMAEEIFMTNSIVGIQWVSGFHKKRYFSSLSKKLLQELQKRAIFEE